MFDWLAAGSDELRIFVAWGRGDQVTKVGRHCFVLSVERWNGPDSSELEAGELVVGDYAGPDMGEFVVSVQGAVDFSPSPVERLFPTSIGDRLGIPLAVEDLGGVVAGNEWRGVDECAPLVRASDHD